MAFGKSFSRSVAPRSVVSRSKSSYSRPVARGNYSAPRPVVNNTASMLANLARAAAANRARSMPAGADPIGYSNTGSSRGGREQGIRTIPPVSTGRFGREQGVQTVRPSFTPAVGNSRVNAGREQGIGFRPTATPILGGGGGNQSASGGYSFGGGGYGGGSTGGAPNGGPVTAPPVVAPPVVAPPVTAPPIPGAQPVRSFTTNGGRMTAGQYARQRLNRGPRSGMSMTPEMLMRLARARYSQQG